MKNLIKTGFIVALLFTTSFSSAKDIPTLRNLENGKTTMLTLLNVKEGNQLIIKNLSGKTFYQEIIRSSGKFRKEFHLTMLADGAYYFELNKYLEVQKIPFEVIDHSVHYTKGKESITPKAISKTKGNYLLVTKPAEIKKPTAQISRRRVLSYKGGDFLNQYVVKKKTKKAKLKRTK